MALAHRLDHPLHHSSHQLQRITSNDRVTGNVHSLQRERERAESREKGVMDIENLPPRPEGYWSAYQKACFKDGAQHERNPPFNTDPRKMEELASTMLSERGWRYAASNAGLGTTNEANLKAFKQWRIIPRMLRDTTQRDTRVTIFGHTLNAPIAFAPIGINSIYHNEAELPVASVAGQLGLAYCLSSAGSKPIEDVAKANEEGAKMPSELVGCSRDHIGSAIRWFQLYAPHDDELCESLLKRAFDSGFTACIWTLDTHQLAWRHDDIALANYAFYRGMGSDLGWTDPVFQKRLKEKGVDLKSDPKRAGELWIDQIWHGKSWSWSDLPHIMGMWKRISGGLPFCLKGIQSVEDAKLAAEMGVDGIVVSNHAGRQVDGAVASIEQLPEIAQVVGDRVVVMFDSGIRGGSDVFKALALGAKLVFIGRLWVYGLSIAGRAGVEHVLRSLLADFDILMNNAGYRTVTEIQAASLKRSGRQ